LGRGSFLSRLSSTQIRDWSQIVQRDLKDAGIAGFVKCLYANHLGEGIMSLIQTAGLGAFQPNCVLVSWPFSWMVVPEARIRFLQAVQVCSVFEKVILVAKEGHTFPLHASKLKGQIDIWWIVADGGIMLLLSFLLQKNEIWRGCKIRLFAIIDAQNDDPSELKADLVKYVTDHRLPVTVRTVAMDSSIIFKQDRFADLNRRIHSRNAMHSTKGFHDSMDSVFCNVIKNAERVIGQHGGRRTVNSHTERYDATLPDINFRLNAHTDPGPRRPAAANLSEVAWDQQPSIEQKESSGSLHRGVSIVSAAKSNWVSSFALNHQRLTENTPCGEEILNCAKLLNKAMKKQSAKSQLVVTNLPDVPDNESAFGYMQFLEHLTTGLPRALLVRGTATEVISAYT